MKGYPEMRLRRLRINAQRRRLLDEPMPGPERFIWPVFVKPGKNIVEPIRSIPGQFRYSVDTLVSSLQKPVKEGIGGILLFGVAMPGKKDNRGSGAWRGDGLVQLAVREIKKEYPDLIVFTDVCLCAYTKHGHCGPLGRDGQVDNDAACEALSITALSHAEAGADGVAPSAMMDGQVAAIRSALEVEGYNNTIVMSYSTKFASSLYGPFRDAELSKPQSGDRQGYQASWRNLRLAERESALDEDEGADILMVKPAMFYLDVIAGIRKSTRLPLAAYCVSGEYSMLLAAANASVGNLVEMVREYTFAVRRAGADLIITYWANRYREIFRN